MDAPTPVLHPLTPPKVPALPPCAAFLACPHPARWWVLHPHTGAKVAACNRCVASLKRDGMPEASVLAPCVPS
jgi:hypothetical protein